jgi:putative Mg2+ transporter-C (MgtC) family protein
MSSLISTLNFSHFFEHAGPIGIKVLFAILCGGLIGIEREFKNKPAGLKTNILICLGATLYTIISQFIPEITYGSATGTYRGDPGRVAAQIVSGVGFLGGGVIMHAKASVHGLTTAATIWTVAAIGVTIGAGYPVVALIFTMTVLFTLLAINAFEGKFFGRNGMHVLEIIFEDFDGQTRQEINKMMEKNKIELEDFEISNLNTNNTYLLRIYYLKNLSLHKRFILDLWLVKGVLEVKQI